MFVRDLLPCMYVLEFYLRRTYLQGRLHVLAWRMQCTASFPANVCIRSRKRLQPPLQTFAVKRIFSSHVFLLSRKF